MGKGLGSIPHTWSLTGRWRSFWGGWMEQCRAVVVGPRELDLAGHGGRREEEEGGEAVQRRGSKATYRPESTWARGVASGGGWFGQGRLDGGLAERAAALCMAGRRGSSGRGPGQVALEGFPGSIWPRTRRGRGPPAAYGRAAAETEMEMEIGTFL